MENNHTYRSHSFLVLLILILGLRITSYFTLFPDSVMMTQAVKVLLRCLLTGTSFILLQKLKSEHQDFRLKFENLTPLMLYGGYLFLGLLSFLWTSLLQYSILQWAMIVEALAFSWFFYQLVVFYNGLSGNHARFSILFGRSTLLIGVAFLLGIFLAPDTFYRLTHGGEVARLGGFIINPNELGMLAVLGAVMAYVELLGKRAFRLNSVVLAISVAVLVLTQSRSSLIAFLLVTAIVVLRSQNMRLIFFSLVAAVLVLPILIQGIIVKVGDLEEVFSLTGRIPFWSDLIADGFTKEPILGYGFMCISYHDYFDSIHAYSAKMTHNTFVQVLLNLGLVGAFICLLQMVATFASMIKSNDKELKFLAGLMLVPVLINSMTEFGIFGESNYGIQFYHFIILFFMVSFRVEPKKKKYAFPTVEKIHQNALA